MVIFGVPLLVLLSPLIITMVIAERWGVRRFRRKLAGRAILVWHSRAGWHDFCMNNLLPALPESITSMSDNAPASTKAQSRRRIECGAGFTQVSRPHLFFFAGKTVRVVSLNGPLQSLKTKAKRDPTIRREVAGVINEVCSRHEILLDLPASAGSRFEL